MRKTVVSGGMVLAVVGLCAFQGCMPETVTVGDNPGAAGDAPDRGGSDSLGGSAGGTHGGSGGAGGSAAPPGSRGHGGTDAGLAGTSGSGASGMGTGGARANAGRGGASGAGGAVVTAGRGGAAGSSVGPAGSGGDAGAPPFTFDADCDCKAYEDGEFGCTLDLTAAQRLTIPSSCDDVPDTDYVHRNSCGSGEYYEWSVGTENEYEAVTVLGTLTYFSANGYVGDFCGIDSESYSYGTIVAGTRPAEMGCSNDCFVCGDPGGPTETALPACDPCTMDPDDPYSVHESLADFCAFHDCPMTLAEGRALLASSCPAAYEAGLDSVLTTGCGVIELSQDTGLGGSRYYYDPASEELVGAELRSDAPFGQCKISAYDGGTVPLPLDCTDGATCTLCTYPPPDAGDTGSAGAGNLTPPPACAE